MNKLYIVCIDDQPEVLTALEQDLSYFEKQLNIEVCDSGKEALEVIEEIDEKGDHLAILISDQVMPSMTGVHVLQEVEADGRFDQTQKVLLTGLATHQDTIQAINTGGLDYYIEKPWSKEVLIDKLKQALTQFIIKMGIDYQLYLNILDQSTLYQSLRKST